MTAEEDQLRVLSILHYVMGGLAVLFLALPLMHIGVGALMVTGRFDSAQPHTADPAGWIFVAIGSVFLVAGLACAAGYLFAGRSLARRESYTFCFVMGALGCAFFPIGTVLGVFTIIALQKPAVRQLFGRT
jgi:hypothetical protein